MKKVRHNLKTNTNESSSTNLQDMFTKNLSKQPLTMTSYYSFQGALKKYGVNDVDVFQTVDLYEKKDIAQVTNTIFALGRQVNTPFSLRKEINVKDFEWLLIHTSQKLILILQQLHPFIQNMLKRQFFHSLTDIDLCWWALKSNCKNCFPL